MIVDGLSRNAWTAHTGHGHGSTGFRAHVLGCMGARSVEVQCEHMDGGVDRAVMGIARGFRSSGLDGEQAHIGH